MSGALPILTYHSVGRQMPDWAWSDLTTPFAVFDDHLRALRRAGYRSVTMQEWNAHARGQRAIDGKAVVLTFDDGYLDNWVFAAPLLERHGFTGTVLVTPEFVQRDDAVRPTLRDAWQGRVAEADLPVRAFMSWEELRRVSRSGVLDVQCHAMTHTWYPVSDEIVDFHHPGDAHYWLDWNQAPQSKPDYLAHLGQSIVPWGTPVYAHEKSLACRRHIRDTTEADRLAEFVERAGGRAFFEDPAWRERLRREVEGEKRTGRGRPESDAEYHARLAHEIVASRDLIATRLDKPVEFFVWPGGGYTDESMAFARRHYVAVTVSSHDRWRYRNRPGENPGLIVRRGVPTLQARGRDVFPNGAYLVDSLDEFRGSTWARRRRQIRKLAGVVAIRAGLWRG